MAATISIIVMCGGGSYLEKSEHVFELLEVERAVAVVVEKVDELVHFCFRDPAHTKSI